MVRRSGLMLVAASLVLVPAAPSPSFASAAPVAGKTKTQSKALHDLTQNLVWRRRWINKRATKLERQAKKYLAQPQLRAVLAAIERERQRAIARLDLIFARFSLLICDAADSEVDDQLAAADGAFNTANSASFQAMLQWSQFGVPAETTVTSGPTNSVSVDPVTGKLVIASSGAAGTTTVPGYPVPSSSKLVLVRKVVYFYDENGSIVGVEDNLPPIEAEFVEENGQTVVRTWSGQLVVSIPAGAVSYRIDCEIATTFEPESPTTPATTEYRSGERTNLP